MSRYASIGGGSERQCASRHALPGRPKCSPTSSLAVLKPVHARNVACRLTAPSWGGSRAYWLRRWGTQAESIHRLMCDASIDVAYAYLQTSSVSYERRAWDSNPDVLADAGFQDRCNSHSANPPVSKIARRVIRCNAQLCPVSSRGMKRARTLWRRRDPLAGSHSANACGPPGYGSMVPMVRERCGQPLNARYAAGAWPFASAGLHTPLPLSGSVLEPRDTVYASLVANPCPVIFYAAPMTQGLCPTNARRRPGVELYLDESAGCPADFHALSLHMAT